MTVCAKLKFRQCNIKGGIDDGQQSQAIFHRVRTQQIISAARKGRYGHRDATLILIMARHGLRVTEAVDLQWDQIDFTRAHLHVRRLKGGIASVHPIQGDELRALRELRRQSAGAFVFASERGGPMTRFNVSKMVEAAGERAGLPFAHPHMLRPYVRAFAGRCGPRHEASAIVARTRGHQAHRALCRTECESIQRVLEMTD
jgi:integrase